MEKLKVYLEDLKNETKKLKENNKFFRIILNGKNIAIILLSFLLFCNIIAYADSDSYKNHLQIEELIKQSEDLKTSTDDLNSKLIDSNKTIKDLNTKLNIKDDDIKSLEKVNQSLLDEKTKLEEENKKLETENKTLETEKQTLNQEIEQIKSSKINNSSSSKSSSITSNTNTNSEIVYITSTGTKYHRDGCSYLKKSKIQTTLSSAQSRGYTPCSRCF